MAEHDPREGQSRIDEALRPYLQDSMLWPVVLVVVLSLASFGAFLIARALERNLFAVGALLGLVYLSVDGVRASSRGGRPGPVALAILGIWVVASVAALFGSRYGFL